MRLSQIMLGVEMIDKGAQDVEITSLSYDTRTITPGAAYFALSGYKTDGHLHIRDALDKGAAAVICKEAPAEDGPYITVPEPRKALALASANWFGHPGDNMTLLAVTGTNGKTTTTYLLKAMLEGALGAKVGLVGTNQNMIGDAVLPAQRTTPESYELQALLHAMAEEGCTHVVMEASSHALVQHRTCGLTFQAGIFTNLTRDHLDFHGTMEAYEEAKGILFTQSRHAVLNVDDPAGRRYLAAAKCPAVTYSENKAWADLTARNIRLGPGGVSFEAVSAGGLCRVSLPIPGCFSIYNALGVLACGMALGLDLDRGAAALSAARGVKGRAEVVPVPADFSVVIDYAHTPDALENILTTLRPATKGRLLVLFGCGGDRDRSKRPVMGAIAARLADCCVVTSDNPRTEEPGTIIDDILAGMAEYDGLLEVEPDRRRAIARVLAMARPGDTVLLAGKGHETYQEVGDTRIHLDEREEVSKFFLVTAETL